MKGKEFFKEYGEKFGMTSEEIAKISGNTNLDTFDVPDEVANLFKSKTVFTEESAKANPAIRAAIRAEALDGVDAHVKSLFSKYELPDDIQGEILKADKTSTRIEKTLERVAELERKKVQSSGKEKTALEKEIEKLNGEILTHKNLIATKEGEWKNKYDGLEIDYQLKSLYNGFQYALPDEMPHDVKIQTARAVVENRLREKGVKFKMTETGLAPFTADDTPYFEDNKKISTADLLKKTLLENKVLKVNDSNGGGNGGQQSQQQQQQNGFKPPKGMEKLNAALQESMKNAGMV